MHNFQIKKVFKSNKKFQRFRDFKRTAYDKFDYKLILLSQLTRELALYETRSQWNETNYDGESYFCKSEFSQSIIQNDTKVSYLNHSILVQKTQSHAVFTFNFFREINLLGMQRSGQLSYYISLWRSEGGYPKFYENSNSQFIKVCVKIIQKQSQPDFFPGNNW